MVVRLAAADVPADEQRPAVDVDRAADGADRPHAEGVLHAHAPAADFQRQPERV